MARSRAAAHRLVTVWLPHWPALAGAQGGDEPVAVVYANRVVAASPSARRDGVLAGLRRREAQSRCPAVRLVDHDPERDARRFEPIARAIGGLVPRLEITEPGWVTFAARGPTRYVGGEENLVERVAALVRAGLAELGAASGASDAGADVGADAARNVEIGLGISEGRFASGVAARQSAVVSRAVIVPVGEAARYLSRFPLRALHEVAGVPCDLLDLLSRLGLDRLGHVADLPSREVLARFGPMGAFAHRLASGADPRPPDAVEPPAELTVIQRFDDPVPDVQPLVFVAKQMAAELHEQLAARGLTAVRLAVEAETEHDERSERVWYRPEGLNQAAMVDRVRWQLDGWVRSPGGLSGGVALLRLVPVETRADAGRQLGFWGGRSEADEWAGRAAARLIGLLGPDAVSVPEMRGGRDPGDDVVLVSAAMVDLADRSARHRLPDALNVATAPRRALRRPVIGEPLYPGEEAMPPAAPGDEAIAVTLAGIRSTNGSAGSPPWPGGLPAPSPSMVYNDVRPCRVLDEHDRSVVVSGRGEVSSAPAILEIGRNRRAIVAWAGPWPVEERWWEPGGGRRRVRFQLVTDDGDAVLAMLERGSWSIEARYV